MFKNRRFGCRKHLFSMSIPLKVILSILLQANSKSHLIKKFQCIMPWLKFSSTAGGQGSAQVRLVDSPNKTLYMFHLPNFALLCLRVAVRPHVLYEQYLLSFKYKTLSLVYEFLTVLVNSLLFLLIFNLNCIFLIKSANYPPLVIFLVSTQ